jgi:rhamnulokinase
VAGSARAYAAVDLGAGSGRVIVGFVEGERIELQEVHRFAHEVRRVDGHERWDLARILAEVERGLAAAGRAAGHALRSVGVDSWGVDHGFLDERGRLLADPISYRDRRTDGALERLFRRVPRAELHARTGIQCMPINTSVQLFAQLEAREWPAAAARLLMLPDLVHRHLCGAEVSEVTNASTTQLLGIDASGARRWDEELCAAIGVPRGVLPALVEAGAVLGRLRPELARRLDLAELEVVAPGTHDTASAVAGTPLEPGWAYVSSGTWSLVGLETRAPVLGERACAENITNEAGVFGTNRLLKNVMGLWLLEASRRAWARRGPVLEHAALQRALAGRAPLAQRLDPDDHSFLNPPDMPAAIAAQLHATAQAPVEGELALSQLVLESLARRYAEVVALLVELTRTPIRGLHVVGGGSQNDFLNQRTADATGLPVRAGPVEATALGNVAVQAIHDGGFADLASARRAIACSFPPAAIPAGGDSSSDRRSNGRRRGRQ